MDQFFARVVMPLTLAVFVTFEVCLAVGSDGTGRKNLQPPTAELIQAPQLQPPRPIKVAFVVSGPSGDTWVKLKMDRFFLFMQDGKRLKVEDLDKIKWNSVDIESIDVTEGSLSIILLRAKKSK